MTQALGSTIRTSREQWLREQNDSSSLVQSGGNLLWNTASTRPAAFTLSQNFIIPNPESLIAGMEYILALTQDSTGSRTITWGACFEWHGEEEPELDLRPGSITIIKFYCDGSTMYGQLFYKKEL